MVLRYVQLAAHERLTAQPLAVRSLGAARVQVNDTGVTRGKPATRFQKSLPCTLRKGSVLTAKQDRAAGQIIF
jgi:hypothetical protein